MPVLSLQSLMAYETGVQTESKPRHGLQRSASIAGITSFSRQNGPTDRRRLENESHIRHHPYLLRSGVTSRPISRHINSEEAGHKHWALHKTRRTQTKPKLHKLKGSTNRPLNNRNWPLSESMLQFNLNLNKMDDPNDASTCHDKNNGGRLPSVDVKDDTVLCNHQDQTDDYKHDDEVDPKNKKDDNTDKATAMAKKPTKTDKQQSTDEISSSKKQATARKTPFTLLVPNQCSPMQMPTPPIIKNISLGGLFNTNAHPRAMGTYTDFDVHDAHQVAPEVDCNTNQSDESDVEVMDERLVADKDFDAQIWASTFDDLAASNLWSCLLQSNSDRQKKHTSKRRQTSEEPVSENPEDRNILSSLRKQDTLIFFLDEPQVGLNPVCDDPDALVCDPRYMEEERGEVRYMEEESEDVLNTSVNEFRHLIPVYRDFCCWVCGSQMETMNLFDMITKREENLASSSSASIMTDGVDLYCPQCDCTRSVFNAYTLL